MPQQNRIDLIQTAKVGIVAGAAGGLAEVVWISIYAIASGADAAQVARGVSTAFGVGAMASAAQAGILIHMGLAALLGLVLAFGWRWVHRRPTHAVVARNQYPFFLAALSLVWLANFFVVLPLVSPEFVGLLPYEISLTSKLIFGLAAAATVRHRLLSNRGTCGPARVADEAAS